MKEKVIVTRGRCEEREIEEYKIPRAKSVIIPDSNDGSKVGAVGWETDVHYETVGFQFAQQFQICPPPTRIGSRSVNPRPTYRRIEPEKPQGNRVLGNRCALGKRRVSLRSTVPDLSITEALIGCHVDPRSTYRRIGAGKRQGNRRALSLLRYPNLLASSCHHSDRTTTLRLPARFPVRRFDVAMNERRKGEERNGGDGGEKKVVRWKTIEKEG
ncbi:hypothetical protein SLE2022_002460 [Rubroshorea leprosula]